MRYSYFWAKISKSLNRNDRPFFPVAGLKQLMVTHVSKTLNAWILFCKTWMATENCYYKKLLIISSSFVAFSGKIRYNLSKFVLNILNLLKLYHCCVFHDSLSFIFLSFTFTLRESIFLPVFPKYVISRIKNIIPIQKSKQWFEYFVSVQLWKHIFKK